MVDPDSEALPVSASAEVDDETAEDTDTEVDLAVEYDDEGEAFDDDADQYEYIDDTSGIPIGEEPSRTATPAFDRRHRYDADKAAAVVARKYAARKRVLMVMALTLVLSAATAFLLTSAAWWFFSIVSAVTVLYLGYLRRQTRIEERVRRRRMQRMARSQLGVENTYDREYDVVPSRLRRPGAVVLEIDDEDPIFEHLDYAPYAPGITTGTGSCRERWGNSGSATSAATGSLLAIRGYGAVGSATRSHRVGQGFESP